jgi:3-oxoacyl-[acyl-carrier protein] reductase
MGNEQDSEFKGLVALVTGASSGIGAETAIAFGSLGAHVLVHCNHGRNQAEAVAGRIREAGGQATILQGDLSTRAGISGLIEQLRESGLAPDILVNNAGSLIKRTPVLEFTPELWEQVFTLNLTSAFFLAQAVLPGMIAKGRGFIVNVSSVAARNGGGIGALAYAAAKGALSTVTKGLAKEFACQGIRVNAVSPGTIETNYHVTFSNPRVLESVANATPAGRNGQPKEIADTILYLCSERASFIHGQVIEINGGFLMA